MRLAAALALGSLLACAGCERRSEDCEQLLAYVQRDLDEGLKLALARGPDALYLEAVGAKAPKHDPRAEAMARNAGLELHPTEAELAAEIAEAKEQFEPRVRDTTAKMRARADAKLVSACKALDENQAACVAAFASTSARLEADQSAQCDPDDVACRLRIREAWAIEHPQCAWLSDWIEKLLAG